MEINKNKKSAKFQGDVLNFCDFIQVFVFTTNHHLNNSLVIFRTITLLVHYNATYKSNRGEALVMFEVKF